MSDLPSGGQDGLIPPGEGRSETVAQDVFCHCVWIRIIGALFLVSWHFTHFVYSDITTQLFLLPR